MVDRYQAAALNTRLGIPLIYGVDTVHGDGNMQGATVFPHNIGLGATRDPALVRRVAHVAASETRSSGPQWAFAPCVCVARDDRWGRIYESYGETPALVERMGTAIDGFQGPAGHLSDNDRVLATAKHFAGDGLTTYGTGSNSQKTGSYPIDQGVDQVDRATFDRLALAPYVDAVRQHHVGSVMPSYSDVDWTEDGLGNPINMHGNRDLITGWLKDQEGFDGFVISDYNGIDHINPGVDTFAQQVATSVNAGVDMFMQPSNFELFETTLTDLVNDGTVPISRIDDAVSRILTKKFQLGLFEHPMTDRTHLSEVGNAAHRAVARRAVAESQVLLKNTRSTLPLSAKQTGVRRGEQRRQHRQPGRRLDPHLAGRVDHPDPWTDDPRRHRGRRLPGHLQPGRIGARAAQRHRCRRGRRDAVLRGLRRRRRSAVGLRPR